MMSVFSLKVTSRRDTFQTKSSDKSFLRWRFHDVVEFHPRVAVLLLAWTVRPPSGPLLSRHHEQDEQANGTNEQHGRHQRDDNHGDVCRCISRE